MNKDVIGIKPRPPTKSDIDNADRWLNEAKYNLTINEYHRVKRFCKQVIRALSKNQSDGFDKWFNENIGPETSDELKQDMLKCWKAARK